MDVALSDILICPRCGPTYGLVLLPYETVDRRVQSGVLGCANCRERYPIEGAVADLRVAGAPTVESGGPEAADPSDAAVAAVGGETEPVVRLAGLMGLAEARGTVLVAGPAAEHAEALAKLLGEVEIVSVGAGGSAAGLSSERRPAEGAGAGGTAGEGGVSRMRVAAALPFRTGALRGVTLTGAWASFVEEGGRVLGREGRLVLDPAPEDAPERLAELALGVVAREGNVVVAARGA